ncbi:MAG TPA: hypothetical protein DEG17_02470 [Cyanobacteria bacterium UBA11149]|nr:hypothetical protein [Cyanobacteria bacterium UBA11367]HBE61017.1 hypothetical protein [Cyanobacteria bacterium UBA11366]HBK63818.1 hypothetical protein [Cyanobacteria bacterium UBA11166]HBR74287.1 hypothetical protein [Cyanobacteria bacterium UBA11159]HBS71074.1 hypothetical protein [Cyanobacteria bacterium UBA11153]HBW87771.1 hypothetical protein [Cyanobacteria bacterium UBA11149]HCA93212.1 hypothetical protein [Cyanobacteria bacterium UBA9226]
MKFRWLIVSLLSCSTILTLGTYITKSASAQCVGSHVGIQLNMSEDPARQTSNVQMESEGSCSGNNISTQSTQFNAGGDEPVRQHQEVHQRFQGSNENPTGVNGPTVTNSVVVPVDVRTPANFKR